MGRVGETAIGRQSVSAQERVDILSRLMGVIQFRPCLTVGNTLNRRVAPSSARPLRRLAQLHRGNLGLLAGELG
jgi:hypothetical protein